MRTVSARKWWVFLALQCPVDPCRTPAGHRASNVASRRDLRKVAQAGELRLGLDMNAVPLATDT